LIFALATPVAQSAIAVFRISGEGCCQKFNSVINKPISNFREVFLRDVVWEGVLVDRCSIVYYSSPSSYSGEDSIDFSLVSLDASALSMFNKASFIASTTFCGISEDGELKVLLGVPPECICT